MGNRKTMQKRLESVREGVLCGEYAREPASLAAAARYYSLDSKDLHQRETLLYVLADALFGSRKRGRRKGSRVAWGIGRLIELGSIYEKKKKQNPKLSDAKIAKLIKEEREDFKNNDVEQIRQRLRKAHYQFKLSEAFRNDDLEQCYLLLRHVNPELEKLWYHLHPPED